MRTAYRDCVIEYDAVKVAVGKPNTNWHCEVAIQLPTGEVKRYEATVTAWSLSLARAQALQCAKTQIDAELGAAPYAADQRSLEHIRECKPPRRNSRIQRIARELISREQPG